MTILVTGGSGWTAAPMIDRFDAAGYSGLVFDIAPPEQPLPGDWRWVKGDVRDIDLLSEICSECHAVVHLAVAVGVDSYQSAEEPFDVNVRGTYNVLEAARRAAIARIVLLSSAPVHLADAGPDADHWRSSAGSDHVYDLTKRLQEEIAEDFSSTFGLHILTLRAGHIVDGKIHQDSRGRALQEVEYCRGGWLCRHDLAEACVRGLESNASGLLTLVGSRSGRDRYQSDNAERTLSFRIEQDFAMYERSTGQGGRSA